jgi:effector-binding domain-containing protein
MTIEPTLTEREARTYAGLRKRVARGELAEIVPAALTEVSEFLSDHSIPAEGPPLVRYLIVDYNVDEVEIDIGFPVGVPSLPEPARIRHQTLPAGIYATVIHSGDYAKLVDTTAALLEWAKQRSLRWAVRDDDKVTRWEGRVEHYLVGPPLETEPRGWRTEIAILVSDPDLT